jgi:Ser/Thr protein kinase RdoA (MazF antagonist)
LRALHQAEPARPDTDIAAWLCERGERRLTAAAAILPAAQRAEIHAHLRALADLGPLPTVPCHLDFTPRNLLRGEDGAVRLIDFEHTRHDLAARDLVRLADRFWKRRPDLKAGLLDTYGPLSDVDRAVIEHATHLDHLTAAVP